MSNEKFTSKMWYFEFCTKSNHVPLLDFVFIFNRLDAFPPSPIKWCFFPSHLHMNKTKAQQSEQYAPYNHRKMMKILLIMPKSQNAKMSVNCLVSRTKPITMIHMQRICSHLTTRVPFLTQEHRDGIVKVNHRHRPGRTHSGQKTKNHAKNDAKI